MEYNQTLPDGSVLYGLDFSEYIKAINNAPPGTLIKVGELTPAQMYRCNACGAEMDLCFTEGHKC